MCKISPVGVGVYSLLKAYLFREKDLQTKIQYILLNYNLTPLDMYNGLSFVYCIKREGRIL